MKAVRQRVLNANRYKPIRWIRSLAKTESECVPSGSDVITVRDHIDITFIFMKLLYPDIECAVFVRWTESSGDLTGGMVWFIPLVNSEMTPGMTVETLGISPGNVSDPIKSESRKELCGI